MPDVNYTSINFDFNSSSGTYDEICANGTCMIDLVRLSSVPENVTNVYCNDFDMCYSYKVDNNVYSYISIFNQSFLVVEAKISEAWTTNATIVWDNNDAYKIAGVAYESLDETSDIAVFPDIRTLDICWN